MSLIAVDDVSVKLLSLVRPHLKFLAPNQTLTMDAELGSLGLDSMGAINLLVEVEEAFGVQLTDEMLSADTFKTPAALAAAMSLVLP